MEQAAAGCPAPAHLWRAFFVGGVAAATFLAAAPPNTAPSPDYLQAGTLSAAAAAQVLVACRNAGPARPYYAEFILRHLPRRGDEVDFPGRLWASRDEAGSVWRVDLSPGVAGKERRFLLQWGDRAATWMLDPAQRGETARRVTPFDPLSPGLEITPFDLEMSFLYWRDARPISVNRIHGRPADLFLFLPPDAVKLQAPDLGSVRSYLDAEFHFPVQTEILGPDGGLRKTFALVDLKKVSNEWLPKEVEARNESTHDKTRFTLTAAASGLDLSPALFLPAALGDPVAPPVSLVRFEP